MGRRATPVVLLALGVLAAAALPVADAAASPDQTVTDTTPAEWDGPTGPGSNTTYDPETGDDCTPPAPATMCDATLVKVDSAFFGGVQLSVADNDLAPGVDRFGLYVYASDSGGTRGELVAADDGPTVTKSVFIGGVAAAPPETYFLVQVVYEDVDAAETYHGKAELLRRDQFPSDIDDPPGLQDVAASDPAGGFRAHTQPHIAQSPVDPNLLVAASQVYNRDQDSLDEDESKVGTYASFDGGQTWRDLGQLDVCPAASATPPTWPNNTCYPDENPSLGGTGSEDVGDPRGTGDFGEEYITSDVWVQFDDEGNAYAVVADAPPFPGEAGWGMTLHKWATPTAADLTAGNTWSHRIPIDSYPAAAADPGFDTLDERGTLAVNNAGQDGDGATGTMVACWTREGDPSAAGPQEIVCKRSTDGGATWPGAPQVLSGGQVLDIDVHVVADSRNPSVFYAAWLNYLPGFLGLGMPDEVSFTRSTDGGQTWEPARTVAGLTSLPGAFPDQDFAARTTPIMAVGPNSEIYVVYSDYRDAPQPNDEDGMQADVMLVRSPDGGESWFRPAKVNQDAGNADQFQPHVAVNAGGQVNVSYFDRRLDARRTQGANVVHPGNVFIDTWLSRSNDGGKTFSDVRVSHDSWDPAINPPTGCCRELIGDYQGLVADCSNAIPFVNDTHLANAVDAGFDSGAPRSVFQQVFSWRVPNTAAFGGGECPKPAEPSGPAPPGPGGPAPGPGGGVGVADGLFVSRRHVRISRSGTAAIVVKCRSAAVCRGRLDLFRFVTKPGQPARRITVGSRRFRLRAGRKGVVRVRIASAQLRVADRRRRLRVVAVAKATFASGGQGRASEGVTLLASRR